MPFSCGKSLHCLSLEYPTLYICLQTLSWWYLNHSSFTQIFCLLILISRGLIKFKSSSYFSKNTPSVGLCTWCFITPEGMLHPVVLSEKLWLICIFRCINLNHFLWSFPSTFHLMVLEFINNYNQATFFFSGSWKMVIF